tara:strand:- start:57 stop:467 length:411 start_codon:yes stop_codon:yes gene_type:complete
MIISCPSCLKKFKVDSKLIPSKGRNLICSSCDHKWFFKNEKELEIVDNNIDKLVKTKVNIDPKKKETNIKKKVVKNKNISILNFILVFLISFVAVIIIIDTFKDSIAIIYPNIDLFLNSLYETLQDIVLFVKDLTF